jgi:hypothetical protein
VSEDKELDGWLEKVSKSKKGALDLSSDEDLSIAIMNLISIEEHFFFTAAKTGKDQYYDLLGQVREMRKSLLKKIVKEYEGEVWCISKHLLSASMRLIEVGTKQQGLGHDKDAKEMFTKAYELYSLFWGLNLNLLNVGEIKKVDDDQMDIHPDKKTSPMSKLGLLVKKAIDCCRE